MEVARYRRLSRWVMTIDIVRPFAICARPLSLELKWLCPAFRARILPFFVTLSLFEYDLFVFICLCALLRGYARRPGMCQELRVPCCMFNNVFVWPGPLLAEVAVREAYALSMTAAIPFGLLFAASVMLKSTLMSLRIRSILSLRNFSSRYLVLPVRNSSSRIR